MKRDFLEHRLPLIVIILIAALVAYFLVPLNAHPYDDDIGACCTAGRCIQKHSYECSGIGTTFYLGVSCDPNPCGQVENCCECANGDGVLPSGTMSVYFERDTAVHYLSRYTETSCPAPSTEVTSGGCSLECDNSEPSDACAWQKLEDCRMISNGLVTCYYSTCSTGTGTHTATYLAEPSSTIVVDDVSQHDTPDGSGTMMTCRPSQYSSITAHVSITCLGDGTYTVTWQPDGLGVTGATAPSHTWEGVWGGCSQSVLEFEDTECVEGSDALPYYLPLQLGTHGSTAGCSPCYQKHVKISTVTHTKIVLTPGLVFGP